MCAATSLKGEMAYLRRRDATSWTIAKGFVPNMRVPGVFYVDAALEALVFDELRQHCVAKGVGGFLPAIKQIANVAALPGIVGSSIGLPDIHSGYGFAIGNVAAFDVNDRDAVVSPGGVGFDINCGVRVLRTNLTEKDVVPVREKLAQSLFDHIPVGVGSRGVIPTSELNLDAALEMGMDWTLREGYSWAEDKEHCFAPDTEVLLADGRRRAIGACAVGDVLVDERGRACAATRVSRGYGQLFEVVYSNGGGRFVCNAAHRLVLYFSSSSVFSSINDDDDDGYRVAYRDLAFDARLGFVAPIDRTIDFLVDKKKTQEATTPTLGDAKRSFGTLAEARAAALALFFFFEDRRRVWEPTVEQYVRFDRELDCCCFRMMRAAPEVLPLASPFPSLASLLDAAYADAEAAGGPRVARAERVSLAEVAYLVGACLGTAGKNRAVVEQPGSGGLDFLARVAPQEVKVRVDGHSRVPILSGSKKTKSKKRDGVVAPLRAVDPNKAHRRTKMPQSDSSRNVVACLLARLGNFGGEAVEHAFARAPADARASFLAGLVDANGSRHGASWTLEGEQRGLPIAMLAYRVALSLGFCASISRDDKNEVARITSPAGDGDVVSPRLAVASKKVPVDEDASERCPRGAALYRFTIRRVDAGEFVSLEVDSASHRFLLADYLVVHNCEEYGRMLQANPAKVSRRAKKRGMPQMGTLGAGNHYAEIQVVDEVHDQYAADRMGVGEKGQVVVMIHSGSRGLGHQVATDALLAMERAIERDQGLVTNDRQLACARIHSAEGQDYLAAMAAAANYAWVNRSAMSFLARQTFAKVFESDPDDLDMHVVYDVSHNIAKIEEHLVDGELKTLLVHRKGATRAFPPHHPLIPVDYQFTGQPVLVGGTMGTNSYILAGTDKGMQATFGSTCHGAGRASSRNKTRRTLAYEDVLSALEQKGIAIRVASPKLVMEEAPEAYKDVNSVVDTCHNAGISKKVVKLRPVAVIKG